MAQFLLNLDPERRGKKALNAEWKKYRRGIEWRCRWLEIRLNELRARSQRYDRLLEERRKKKAQAWVENVQPGEESSARSAQMVDSPDRGRILRRMRRKQVENSVDLELYMARHPLFSRYGTYGESKCPYLVQPFYLLIALEVYSIISW